MFVSPSNPQLNDFDFSNPCFFRAVIDERVFLVLGNDSSNDSPGTSVYELDHTGQATRRFRVPGAPNQWMRIR